MKEVKVYYTKVKNMGDLLNELIIEKVFNYKVIKADGRFDIDTTGIGSGLNGLFPNKSKLEPFPKRALVLAYDKFTKPMQIWSTGFISYPTEEEIGIRKNVKISCVRGELTRKRLEKITGQSLEGLPTGDGGLLTSELLDKTVSKKYNLGIIPHYKEVKEARFQQLADNYKNSTLIDLSIDPMEVIKLIASCEYILSSSLHGLIVADSFGIPNKRLIYTDNLLGDGYKFDDYYSAFGLTSHKKFDLNTQKYPEINEISDDYVINYSDVEQKKEDLRKSFTKYL